MLWQHLPFEPGSVLSIAPFDKAIKHMEYLEGALMALGIPNRFGSLLHAASIS
jgi:hypothetical protein